MEIKKILVPTDFSDCADNALAAAVSIAKQSDAAIYLLHILTPASDTEKTQVIAIDGEAPHHIQATEQLAQARQHIKDRMEQYAPVEIDGGICFDLVSRQIFEFIADKDVDMIVMGSHGAKGIKEVTVGSNTQKVVRNATVPVLVIKSTDADFMPRNVIFPADFEKPAQYTQAANFLKQMNVWFGSTAHLLKIITPNNFEISSTSYALMERFAEKHDLPDFTVNTYNSYNEEEGILTFAEENKADLIAMSTHGRKGFMHVLMGSITENVTNQSEIPILTFKLKED
ncbi:MAG: universal stress protein [Bernardetiaceae bacterium]